jgi:hypothetical protein
MLQPFELRCTIITINSPLILIVRDYFLYAEKTKKSRPPRKISRNCRLCVLPARSDVNSVMVVHRVHILVEMKQGQCICPLSWSVHCNFTGEGKCNERGWACTPHPHQPGLILPSSRQKAAVATLCTLFGGQSGAGSHILPGCT